MDKEITESFEIIDAVNCTDVDVYLKLIMLDNYQCTRLRADLCNSSKKYLEEDKEVLNVIKENNYKNYNPIILDVYAMNIKKFHLMRDKLFAELILKKIFKTAGGDIDILEEILDNMFDNMGMKGWDEDYKCDTLKDDIGLLKEFYSVIFHIYNLLVVEYDECIEVKVSIKKYLFSNPYIKLKLTTDLCTYAIHIPMRRVYNILM
jgi:hypothetical protein